MAAEGSRGGYACGCPAVPQSCASRGSGSAGDAPFDRLMLSDKRAPHGALLGQAQTPRKLPHYQLVAIEREAHGALLGDIAAEDATGQTRLDLLL